MTIDKIRRERLRTTGWLAVGALLIAVLIWFLLQSPDAKPRPPETVTTIALLSPPSPPPPRKITRQRQVKAPAAAAPASTPTPPPPKSHTASTSVTPVTNQPPAMNTLANANPYQLPQGSAEGALPEGGGNGLTIGGGGSESTCGNLMTRSYLDLINAQVMHVFRDRGNTGNRDFQVQARIWFDAAGSVQKTELADSTGDTDLDRAITRQLGQIALGQGIPQCMQPIQLRVSEPWTGSFSRNKPARQSDQAKQAQSELLLWKHPAHP